jgi:AcrR family transcriptional regulator
VEIILTAAARIFSELGYASATTNHIARRAGVSIGSLYQYFPNKDSLLCRLLERHIQEGYEIIVRVMPEIEKIGRIDRTVIKRLVMTMLDMHRHDPALHRLLFEEVRTSIFQTDYKKNEDFVVERLLRLLEQTPNRRTVNPKAAVQLMSHTIEAMTHRFILYGYDGLAEAEFVSEVTDLLAGYLLEE